MVVLEVYLKRGDVAPFLGAHEFQVFKLLSEMVP